jgi:hypothetical protein
LIRRELHPEQSTIAETRNRFSFEYGWLRWIRECETFAQALALQVAVSLVLNTFNIFDANQTSK